MSASEEGLRHLNREGLQQYLSGGAHTVVKIDGQPPVFLIVEPAAQKLSLRTPLAKNALPDLSNYRNLSCEIVHWEERQWCQLSITGPVILDAYPLLYAVADRMQLQGAAFERATIDALAAFSELLAGDTRLSDEQETGLFGELLVLKHLLETLQPHEALAGWRGADAEEHDFDLGHEDCEVKCTTSETRRHWIGSISQLSPTAGRPLWLASMQLTGAGAGGRTLAELVSSIEARLESPETVGAFRAKLRRMKWHDEAAASYTRKLRLRTSPEVFLVGESFPALTAAKLAALQLGERVVQIRYMIDLTNLVTPAEPPAALRGLRSAALQ